MIGNQSAVRTLSLAGNAIEEVDDEEGEWQSWTVNCLCGAIGEKFDDGRRMVECTLCKNWVHTECNGILLDNEPPENFICNKVCKGKKTLVASNFTVGGKVHICFYSSCVALSQFS